MIYKIILHPNENLSPCIVKYSDKDSDYIVDVPNGITRYDLIELINEIKRITEYEEV